MQIRAFHGWHGNLEKEPIQLRFRQRIRALLLNGVLRCQHQERRAQSMGFTTHRDRPFLHRLKQRGLALGARAVHFIGKQNLREDWPRTELHDAMPGIIIHENLRANNVRRHQIRSELNTTEVQVQRVTKRSNQERLSQTGNAFKENVTTCKECPQRLINDRLLTNDALTDRLA